MTERRKKLMTRWSLVTAGAIALFWTAWYLINGSVPQDPLVGISRWWDILLGSLYSAALILIFTSEKVEKCCHDMDRLLNTDLRDLKITDPLFWLTSCLTTSLIAGLIAGLFIGPIAGLATGLAASLIAGLATLAASLIVGLIIGSIVGLTNGLIAIKPLIVKSWKWLLVK